MADDNDVKQLPDAPAGGTSPGEGQTATGYVANFDGDEIDGKRYALGERIADTVDAGTIAYLVQNGRITGTAEGGADTPSGGTEEATRPTGGDGKDEGPTLTAEQQADADKLVADNTKEQLLAIAEDGGVEGVTADNNKAEIAAKIIAAQSANE
jgi:hypothetical protein